MTPLRIAWLRLTGCAGCQLSLLNAEAELAGLAPLLELAWFPLVSSRVDSGEPLDVLLVEGALSSPEELEPLIALRRRTPVLIAVGACALGGGVPALAGRRRGELFAQVYGPDKACASFPPQPVRAFVDVDLEVNGRNLTKDDADPQERLLALASLTRRGLPDSVAYPVCFECRRHEYRCLLFETIPRQPCLGAVTRGGCDARCPGQGIACEGCRGNVGEARHEQLSALLAGMGIGAAEIRGRTRRFGEEMR